MYLGLCLTSDQLIDLMANLKFGQSTGLKSSLSITVSSGLNIFGERGVTLAPNDTAYKQ